MIDWCEKQVKDLGEIITGRTPRTTRKDYYGGDYNLISPADLNNGKYIRTAHRRLSKLGFEQCRALPRGTVLVGCIGNIGKLGIVGNDKSATNQQINALICNAENDPEFVYYCFHENRIKLEKQAVKTTVPILNKTNFGSFVLKIPPLPEQKKIAHILSTVQRAIEAQERIIQTTTELKKALMHKLFTEGLRNEPQKQTEIGPVPESWEVVRCEEVCDTTSVGIVVKPTQYYVSTGVPALRSQNVRVDRMQMEPMVYISEETNDGPVAKSKLRTGDVLIVRTGANLGMSCVLPAELDGCNCIDLLFIRTKPDQLNGSFLSRFINSEEAKKQVGAGKTGMAQPHFNVGTVKRIFIPLPPLEEQAKIVGCLEQIDQKHDLATSKRCALKDLFRTLLHELMTAQTRVHDSIDF